MKFEPILSFEKTRTFKPIKVITITFPVSETKSIISKLAPIPINLKHLKRIRRIGDVNEVIVCTLDSFESLQSGSLEVDIPQVSGLLPEFKEYPITIRTVSRYPPFTDTQFNEWKEYWPLVYHHSQSRKLDYLSDQVQMISTQFVQQLLEGSDIRIDSDKQLKCMSSWNKCMIVNPNTNQVVAVADGSTPSTTLTLGHCIMAAIDQVSSQERNNRKRSTDDTHKQYYCTGYDLYTFYEPCTMCSMALVHSRIRRVFYCQSSEGALEQLRIHTLESLNHHYQVFKVI